MQLSFILLGIVILVILGFLLWFVPHLLQQQALRAASEAAELREIIADMINEQEAVAMRQTQLSTSLSYLQDQLEQLLSAHTHNDDGYAFPMALPADADARRELEDTMRMLQQQINEYMLASRARNQRDNESWAYLLSLLATIQERIHTLSTEPVGAAISIERGNSHEYHRHR